MTDHITVMIHGYCRHIISQDYCPPNDIMYLVNVFYGAYKNTCEYLMLRFKERGQMPPRQPVMSVLHVPSGTVSKQLHCRLRNSWCSGYTIIKQIKLPLFIEHYNYCKKSLDIHTNYDLLIRVSGYANYLRGKQCRGVLINKCNEQDKLSFKLFGFKLPDLKKVATSCSLIYDYYDENLFAIGGFHLSKTRNIIQKLSFKELNENAVQYDLLSKHNVEWNILPTQMKFSREGCVTVSMRENMKTKLFICGGYNSNNKTLNQVELFDVVSENTCSSLLTAMHQKRYKPGICYNNIKQNIFVGGGGFGGYEYQNHVVINKRGGHDIFMNSGYIEWPEYYEAISKSVEYFDIYKNKWILMKQCKYNHSFEPCIWSNNEHPNILYIAGNDGSNIKRKSSDYGLGFVEWIDMRDTAQKWSCLWDRSLHSVYGKHDFKRFERRTLMIF
eukprot:149150_1